MKTMFLRKGGPGSGDRGHSGRPGQVGGSGSGTGTGKKNVTREKKKTAKADAEIMKQAVTPYDTPGIIKARIAARNMIQTYTIHTPERKALREKIVNELYGNGAKKKNFRIDIVLGPPSAGKSTVFADPLVEEHGALLVDSDEAKKLLPEFNGGHGAGAVHEESAMIIESDGGVFNRAIENGDNIVLPMVGKNLNKMRTLIKDLNKKGYEVHLHLNELPIEEACKRAVARFEKQNRFVDPAYVLSVGLKPTEVYDIIKKEKGVASYEKYSNDVEFGQKPIFIEKGGTVGGSGRQKPGQTDKHPKESSGQTKKEQLVAKCVTSNDGRLFIKKHSAPTVVLKKTSGGV